MCSFETHEIIRKMDVRIEASWKTVLHEEFEKPYFQTLVDFVKKEYQSKTIYPPASQIFAAFDNTPFDAVKVVIIGQDPYHGPNQANGLCFSVHEGFVFLLACKIFLKN